MVPASAITDIAAGGAGFAGFAAWLDMTPAYSDVLVLPDPVSFLPSPPAVLCASRARNHK